MAEPRLDGAPDRELPELLPARMLNEFIYCPRLFYYEWVEGLFRASADTIEGSYQHAKGDSHGDALVSPEELGAGSFRVRGVMLSSESLALIARMDVIEVGEGSVAPVDYKRGRPRETEGGWEAWPTDAAQVLAQALILRDQGYVVKEGWVYYRETRQRVQVPLTSDSERWLRSKVVEARETARQRWVPPPLVDSPKCPRCSLVGICLPDETVQVLGVEPDADFSGQLPLFDCGPKTGNRLQPGLDEVRRLVPARDDARPMYVTGYGLSIGKKGERLEVREAGALVQDVRLNDVSQVNVFGPVSVTGAVVQALADTDKPISYFSMGGWFHAMTTGPGGRNVLLRRDQFLRAGDEAWCLDLARRLVVTKIRNQRTLLQRNHADAPAQVLSRLKQQCDRAVGAGSLESLLGVEGTAAALYFVAFAGMLKASPDAGGTAFEFTHRNRRPPRDPVNAMLSFAYSLLAKDVSVVCHGVGLDPYMGFFHQPRFGRPALALDLMEGFRPLIGDSVVLTAVNTRMVTADHFVKAGQAVALTKVGRSRFLRAYEQRMDQLVTHPVFGYRISYRRVLEVQARLLARFITGETRTFPGFETR
jgi:CRISPR-associated protein Cas1